MKTINIAREFSRHPIGRFLADSDTSGQAFREQLLLPALRDSDGVVAIILDEVAGLPSSFMDEAFAGLVRYEGYTAPELRRRLKFEYAQKWRETYEGEIWGYIEDEENEQRPVAMAM